MGKKQKIREICPLFRESRVESGKSDGEIGHKNIKKPAEGTPTAGFLLFYGILKAEWSGFWPLARFPGGAAVTVGHRQQGQRGLRCPVFLQDALHALFRQLADGLANGGDH